MPSGSKKRKSKKPSLSRPQGGPPELEAGLLEEAMENNGVEVGEATPSPKGIQGDPEAMAERVLEGKEMNGEAPQERDGVREAPKEGFQTDVAVPDQDEGDQGDPPLQAEPKPEIPAPIKADAPAGFDLRGGPAQGETKAQIDSPLMEFDVKTDAPPEDIKPEAVPVESEPVFDATPDASPDEIKPDADTGLDEVDASKESATLERESMLDAAPIGSESGMDESSVETKTNTDGASVDIEREIDKGLDECKPATDAAPAIFESEIGEPLVEVKPEADATPYIEPQMSDKSDEVPVDAEPKMDGAPPESKPEMEDVQVEELETAAPTEIEPETKIEPETEEEQIERELVTEAALVEIEPETEEALMEIELETEAAPTTIEARVEEALAERELEKDAAPIDVESEMDAAPADTKAEKDTALLEVGASPDEIPPKIDTASPDNKTIEIKPDANAAVVEAEQDDVSQAEIKAAFQPEVEALVEGEPEVSAEYGDRSAEIEAKTEPPLGTEPEPKPLDVAEDKSLELPQEIEPGSKVVATGEAKPEDETLADETRGEERRSVETESDQQDLVEGKIEAWLEINPEQEVETSRGIELDAEAEVPLEAEPELVMESRALDAEVEVPLEAEPEPMVEARRAEAQPDGKGPIETESDQQESGEIESDQSGVKEHDQQLQKEGEAELGELGAYVSEDNHPSELQPQLTDASEVPVIEDETPAISTSDEAKLVDDSTSSTLSSETSDNADNKITAIEQEPEEDDNLPPSATVLEGEGESTVKDVTDNQYSGGDVEQTRESAVQNEQGAADELLAESKEDISEDQQRAIDVGHDVDVAVLASAGNDSETKESSEQELAIELPPADVEESAKEDISEQDRAVGVGHDEDGAVSASAGKGGEAEVSSEQELGIELPPADVVDVEEFAEGPPPSDQEPVTEQPQPLIDEQDLSIAVHNEQGAADELLAESKEDISEDQQREVDVGHAEDVAVLASAGNDSETKESSEQELAIELPPADVEESAKEDISEQERAVGVRHDEDGAVSASAGKGGEAEVSSEQELGIELPQTPPSYQEPVTKQPQPLIDELDLSMGLADEPTSVESEQSLNATLPSSESKITSDAPEPQDEAVTPANDESLASECEFNLESACVEPERDIGEEEAASSTVAEAGSVLNDFDERASYEQELPMEFPSADQDVDIPDCKEFDDNLSTEAPESVEAGFREQLDSELFPAERNDANAGCGLEASSELQEVHLESVEAAKPAKDLHSALAEKVLSDEQLPSQPEQVAQDNGGDEFHSSKEIVLVTEEPRTGEEERAACEDDKVAANSILGTALPVIAGDELISKAFTYLENGQQTMSSTEGPSNELVEHRDESSIHRSQANNPDKAEIHAMVTQESEAEHNPLGGDTNDDASSALVESASLNSERRDIKGVQAFRQESNQEPSLPVVVPAQDRSLEHVSLKSTEQPSGGGTLTRRTKLLGCCGMFDLLLRKN